MATDAPAPPATSGVPLPSRRVCLDLLRRMVLIRRFEEAASAEYARGRIGGFLHTAVGEEAVIVGAARALREGDLLVSAHREHGQALARGCQPGEVMAELFGRVDGLSGGRGGSMHMFDPERRLMGGYGTVGANLPIAAGLALASDLQGTTDATLCVFGAAAASQGTFAESLNLAALWRLPVVFLAIATARADADPPAVTLRHRAEAFGVAGRTCDGLDVLAVHEAVADALRTAREDRRPQLVEALVPARRPEPPADGRREALSAWRRADPIAVFADRCVAEGVASDEDVGAVDAEVAAAIAEAVDFAAASAFPEPDAPGDACAPDEPPAEDTGGRNRAGAEVGAGEAGELRLREALGTALREEMQADERVIVIGEDVGEFGGAFKVTEGLLAEFGARRVRDTPISENTIVGAGIGAAIGGLRPVVELMTINASLLALDQIVNTAANVRTMSGGRVSAPLVIRMPQGGGHQLGPTHSHALEALYMHVPGLLVAAPTTPADARSLLREAIRADDPVIFIEHESLYAARGELPAGDRPARFGAAAVRRTGADVTVVGVSRMVHVASGAAEMLSREHGVEAEVIDPRTLRPLDLPAIVASVRRTNRAVVVEEGWPNAGVGATLAALIAEEAFDDLDAPVVRVSGADAPMPYSKPLEQAALPSQQRVVAAVLACCRGG